VTVNAEELVTAAAGLMVVAALRAEGRVVVMTVVAMRAR
jgi:hypothetical protein